MSTSDRKTEVRFAVVMYGGVSLAIYMNGIAQELLRMVRATATRDDENHPRIPYAELDTNERIYRKLAYWQENIPVIDQAKVVGDEPLPRSFRIDIISGTSAGGINGIFLAKALANCQKIEELKKLWITEGDVNLLLNDSKSLAGTGLQKQPVPASLFNSRRMYQKLLKAFQTMDAGTGKEGQSPLVNNIDLFVTATDIRGLVLPIELADTAIYERKYRNVFHFSYTKRGGKESPWNDFNEKFNPMLAFAARCTSSFPFAFEPMRFCDIDEVLATQKIEEEEWSSNPEWKRFFTNYPDKAPIGTVHYAERPFGDGGYLDNKPFSYAIDAVSSRKSDYPGERKLLYIEPVPEHPENETEKDGKPNAIENAMAALLTLPRRESIREDINRILERNRLNERIERIISNLETDKELADWRPRYEREQIYENWVKSPDGQPEPLWAKPDLNDREWATLDLTDLARRKGPGYVAYQRLQIAALTDDFGRLIARVAGFDEDSGISLVFRNMIKAWRDIRFIERRTTESSKSSTFWGTQNAYLHGFDITFPIRRLNFIHRQIDRLYLMDDATLSAEIDQRQPDARTVSAIATIGLSEAERKQLADFRHFLLVYKKKVNERLLQLTQAGRLLRSRFRDEKASDESAHRADRKPKFQQKSPVFDDVMKLLKLLELKPEIAELKKSRRVSGRVSGATAASGELPYGHVIDYFLDKHHKAGAERQDKPEKGERYGEARMRHFILDEHNKDIIAVLDNIARQVKQILEKEIEDVDTFFRRYFGEAHCDTERSGPEKNACSILWSYYRRYSNYDMVIFPILYGTDGSEGEQIDVIRISPEDALGLIDERTTGLHKLGGRNLANFGAFMEKRWRQNDIMWGQLDGAERIISSLISDTEQARKLIAEAHAAIICETIVPLGVEEGYDLLIEPFMHTINGQPDPDSLSKYISAVRDAAALLNRTGHQPHCVLSRLDVHAIRDHYLKKFPINKGLEPENALKNAARATTITSKLLSDIADQYQFAGKKYLSMVTKAGQIMLWLVEASMPHNMKSYITKHWLKLLYLFEVILIGSSILFTNPPVRNFAFIAIGVTLALHMIFIWIRGIILRLRGTGMLFRAMTIMLPFLFLLLLVVGGYMLAALMGINESGWQNAHAAHDWIKAHFHSGK